MYDYCDRAVQDAIRESDDLAAALLRIEQEARLMLDLADKQRREIERKLEIIP